MLQETKKILWLMYQGNATLKKLRVVNLGKKADEKWLIEKKH